MYYILYNEQQWYKAMVVGTRLYLYYYHWVDILSFLCCVFMFCLSSSCVLCAQCDQCLWIVCLRPVSCVSNVASVSGLFVFVLCLMCPMLPVSLNCLSSSCVLCAQCCQCLWIVCLRPVSCVPNVASLSGLSILWFSLTSVCSNTHQLPLFGRGLRYSSSQEPYI